MNALQNGPSPEVTRRDFLVRAGLASAGLVAAGDFETLCPGAEGSAVPIVVFTKSYQPLKLTFAEAAALTVEAGLDGVDSPVRPDGEVPPERAAEDLTAYVEALRKRSLQMPLITTAITSAGSPHAESLLRTAKRLGVRYYRLGFMDREKTGAGEKQLREIKAQLKDLAELNKEIGIGAIMQNHSPSGRTYVGGDLDELWEIVSDFDPAQLGVAFDIGHALIVHGDGWRPRFEKLKSHLKIAYIKDATRAGRWVKFGDGDVGGTGYFKLLKQIGYHAPISMHIEYDWSPKGQPETRAGLLKVMQENLRVLKQWLSSADF